MSEALQLALVGLAGAGIAGLPAILVAINGLRRVKATVERKADETSKQIGEVSGALVENTKATEEIKHKVDGHASAAAAEIQTLRMEIALLRELMADKDKSAALLASALTVRGTRASDKPASDGTTNEKKE